MRRILIMARNKNFPSIGMREAFSIHKDILQRMEAQEPDKASYVIPPIAGATLSTVVPAPQGGE